MRAQLYCPQQADENHAPYKYSTPVYRTIHRQVAFSNQSTIHRWAIWSNRGWSPKTIFCQHPPQQAQLTQTLCITCLTALLTMITKQHLQRNSTAPRHIDCASRWTRRLWSPSTCSSQQETSGAQQAMQARFPPPRQTLLTGYVRLKLPRSMRWECPVQISLNLASVANLLSVSPHEMQTKQSASMKTKL